MARSEHKPAGQRHASRRTEVSAPPWTTTDALAESAHETEKRAGKLAKKAAKAAKKGEHGRLTPGRAKRIIGVAKVVGPVLAPFALKAASAVRDTVDRMRARRLGVPVDDLGSFTGKGAALHARISGDADALRDLRARSAARTDEESIAIEQFTDAAEIRLAQLTSAVRAAERMPAARRKAAHRAVDGELSRIEDDLLRRFGI